MPNLLLAQTDRLSRAAAACERAALRGGPEARLAAAEAERLRFEQLLLNEMMTRHAPMGAR